MAKKLLKTIIMYILLMLACYLAIGYLFHLVIFPEKKPALTDYFKPGMVIYSKAEKVRQTVIKHESGLVYCSAELDAFAPGPPKHIHTDFDETFAVENGELSVWVDGTVKKIYPGESLLIPKGTPHQPYNETGETIRVKGTVAFPEKFAFTLFQVYALMDQKPGIVHSPKIIFQMALLQQAGFDSYMHQGLPLFAQKALGFLLAPLARLMGYKTYYGEFDGLH